MDKERDMIRKLIIVGTRAITIGQRHIVIAEVQKEYDKGIKKALEQKELSATKKAYRDIYNEMLRQIHNEVVAFRALNNSLNYVKSKLKELEDK